MGNRDADQHNEYIYQFGYHKIPSVFLSRVVRIHLAYQEEYLLDLKQGNPHRYDESCSSFNSQISQVFKHPHKENLYIAIADRWIPDYVMTKERYEWLSRTIASNYDRKKYKAGFKDLLRLFKTPLMKSAKTSLAQYVWLPLRFE
ncbi:hypothetical protein FACS18947_3540 [Bacteroidia bacterium]|nr:hypothetical protein FACS18947_3540 [Bacteroidia bacterium]